MQTTTKTTARRIALLTALPLVGALALAGCSSDDDRDDVAAPAASAPSVSRADGAGTDDTAAGSTGTPGKRALVTAAATAREAVGSGTVTSIEQEAGGTSWEVLVVTADGAEQEVHVAADGARTTAGPTAETSDAEDVAENKRLVGAADLSVAQAAAALTKTVSGTVTELGLDDHAGAVVWEGDVRDGSGTEHAVRIDAGSGAVVTNSVDTDD